MDSKKIAAVLVVVIVVAGAAGGWIWYNNSKDKGETISIAYLNLGYYPFMVGFSEGWFDDLDFNVEPVIVSGSGQDAVNAVLSGDATMAATGDAPFINTLGKYPDDIIGLAQYSQGSGSLSGHQWVVRSSEWSGIIPERVVDGATNQSTNSADVVAAIKNISASGEGRYEGKFAVALADGSTTETNFKKWCNAYGLKWCDSSNFSQDADVVVVGLQQTDASMLTEALDSSVDALAINSTYYETISDKQGDNIYVIGDSSSIVEESYSVFCTTKANYDKYYIEMLEVLEVLKDICDWIKANPEKSAEICSGLSGATAESILKSINKNTYNVTWNTTSDYDAWVETAEVNGYSITAVQFIQACPHRDIINSWYSDTAAAA